MHAVYGKMHYLKEKMIINIYNTYSIFFIRTASDTLALFYNCI